MDFKRTELFKKIVRYTPLYKRTIRSINEQNDERKVLYERINSYIQNVPYYHNYIKYINKDINIKQFPIIRKPDIQGHELSFVSRKVSKFFIRKEKTGGSTGWSLTIYRSVFDSIISCAYVDYIFSLIGDNLKVAVLRGNKPKNGIFEKVSSDKIILSSYSLSPDSLDKYLQLLRDYHISCIHAYPSTLSILSRLIKQRYGRANLPDLKGILTSSEIFSKEEKALVTEIFPNVKIIDFYGLNERCCYAYSIGMKPYHFMNNFGYVEFIETEKLKNGNVIAEIVATSIMNTTMPFIRYGTEDFVELDNKGNILSIIGRTSDFVVNNFNDLVPCIVITRNESKKNIINFQYFQDSIGTLEYRVVVNNDFTEKEKEMLEEDLCNSFDGKMKCIVKVVNEIERTKIGKQKRLIQKLDLSRR